MISLPLGLAITSAGARRVDDMTAPQPKPLLLCPGCEAEMRLLGIEPFSASHELYTFECIKCTRLEARSVLLN